MTAAALPGRPAAPQSISALLIGRPHLIRKVRAHPRERYEPYLPDDKVIWFQLTVPSIQLRHLAAHFRALRL